MTDPEPDLTSLEPDEATLRAWLAAFGELAIEAITTVEDQPAVGKVGREGLDIAQAVSTPIGEAPHPGGVAALIDLLRRAAGASFLTSGPGYLAYVPGGGLPAAAMADLVSTTFNRYTGVAAAAPAFCRLEADTLAWLARAFGLGDQARGLFTSGGSLANFAAVVTARHDKLADGGDYRDATAYTSTQAHHSVSKSIRLAGIPPTNVRAIAVDERFRLRPDALAEAIARDRAEGLRPFLVVSAAGTTNTGAIDPLGAVADLCDEHGLWHHVDAAYGGAFVLCDEGRRLLAGIERADSITFDPHKGLFLPYGTGCLLVRDGMALFRAHATRASYLQDFDAFDRSEEPPSPSDFGPELSRDFRGLRVWLPLQLHGAAAFRAAVAEKLELARRFHAALRREVEAGAPLEIVDAPQLSTVPFRAARRPSEPLDAWNRRNAALLEAINRRHRVFLSSTALPVEDGEAFTLRVCVLSFRTHARHVDACVEDIVHALDAPIPGVLPSGSDLG